MNKDYKYKFKIILYLTLIQLLLDVNNKLTDGCKVISLELLLS
jgi:hypothetical protein